MKSFHIHRIRILLAFSLCNVSLAEEQKIESMPILSDLFSDEKFYHYTLSSKEFPQKYADYLRRQQGESEASQSLLDYAKSNNLTKSKLFFLRNIGMKIDPNFSKKVMISLNEEDDPLLLADLLYVARRINTDFFLENIGEHLFTDTRVAENFNKQKKAHGILLSRVCDITHNVYSELDGSEEKLGSYLTYEQRDRVIEKKLKRIKSRRDRTSGVSRRSEKVPIRANSGSAHDLSKSAERENIRWKWPIVLGVFALLVFGGRFILNR